jgi:hypothetical protein
MEQHLSQLLAQLVQLQQQLVQSQQINRLVIASSVITTMGTIGVVLLMFLQTRQQHRFSKLQVFSLIFERLEETRMDRRTVRDWLKKYEESGTDAPVPPEDIEVASAVDRVCREFDLLGLLERNGLVDSLLVDEFYSVPFALLYQQYLKRYMYHLRKGRRGPTHFWELTNTANAYNAYLKTIPQ